MSSPPERRPGLAPAAAPARSTCHVDFEGRPIPAHPGEPLAVALLAAGIDVFSRSIKFHRPRGPFCLTGDCGACLMRIGGLPNQKACQVPAQQGLAASRQNAWPSAGVDVLAAADALFPEGMDHHTMITAPRPLNALMRGMVRKLGGLGTLPTAAPAGVAGPRTTTRSVDVVVVGAGPAGLAAAAVIAGGGQQVLCIEGRLRPGGSYLSDVGAPDSGPAAAHKALELALAAGVELLCPAQAIGWYAEDAAAPGAPPGLLAVATEGGLCKLTARRYVYACGAHEQNALFVDNDRPGVIAARAAGLLLVTYGLLLGKRPAVLGRSAYAQRLCAALAAAGAEVFPIDGQSVLVRRALVQGLRSQRITAVEIEDGHGPRIVPCDLLAVATEPAPAAELLRQHGAQVDFSRGFAAVVDRDGRTHNGQVYAAGDVTGFMDVAAARDHGAAVGAAVLAQERA